MSFNFVIHWDSNPVAIPVHHPRQSQVQTKQPSSPRDSVIRLLRIVPAARKASDVTWVAQKTEKKRPFGWDLLIWIFYDRFYVIQEAWEFAATEYRVKFAHLKRLSPDHMRQGRRLA